MELEDEILFKLYNISGYTQEEVVKEEEKGPDKAL